MPLGDEETTPEQIEIFRRMSGERRLELAAQLYWSARTIKAAGLRKSAANFLACLFLKVRVRY
jgi:hypothetical protein